jgi:hypothetical protein
MPNEQQYLDRDVFDPWNPYPGCNMEHYYAISCFAGDIGLKKRIWEILPLFGRKWYVWDSDHRTLTEDEFARHHEEILRHADYCYYPLEHEWAVVRHDFIEQMSYKKKRLMPYLRDFLAEHPEYDIGLNEETENLTREQHRRLMFACYQEWMQYACERIFEDAARDNQWMRSVNPDVKRACYGPFPIYAYPLTTYNSMRYIGFPTDEGCPLCCSTASVSWRTTPSPAPTTPTRAPSSFRMCCCMHPISPSIRSSTNPPSAVASTARSRMRIRRWANMKCRRIST